ncbi:MAG: helix-turn-helix domain-containing protein [Nitrospirales bacterium]|jgi:excisionase family DNA binding protein
MQTQNNIPSKNNFKNIELRSSCPQILRLDEAAQILTVSRRTIMALLQAGTLTGKKIGRRRVMLRAELEKYIGAKL